MNGHMVGIVQCLARLMLIVTLAYLTVGGVRMVGKNHSQTIALQPLPLDSSNPRQTRVGAMTFMGAWELRSDNENFGGISGVIALPDDRFLAISDAGTMIGFGLSGNRIERTFIAALPGAFGPNINYRDRDSEGMAYDPASGRIWVSYEQRHSIRRFPPSVSRVDGLLRLPGTKGWKRNQGVEAMARLNDGRFVLFAEGSADATIPATLYSGDPLEQGSTRKDFRYLPPTGYKPTDATPLPDGRLLVLHRRIAIPNGFSAKIGIVDPTDISGGNTIKPQIIASLAPPLLVDNLEGITTTQENQQLIIWLMSDNNFNIFQRTLLMKFALTLPNKKPEAAGAPGFDSL
jgi:hypothetical protein